MNAKINADKARKMVLAAPVDSGELALRIMEAYHGMKRPPNKTAAECINQLDERDRRGAMAAALAAMLYFTECVQSKAGTVQ
jgi:hypothetical protein